jgi:hypothetical protein
MKSYWITFTDGTQGCCQGESPYDAKQIAEHVSGKTVSGTKYGDDGAEVLPYPAEPVIWQFEHPICGKTPTFCYKPKQCVGRSSCPQNRSCTE